jgi:hypothetical protein
VDPSTGVLDPDRLPDLIPVADRNGDTAGYVKRADYVSGLEDPENEAPIPVYDREGRQVGWMVPGAGFRPMRSD